MKCSLALPMTVLSIATGLWAQPSRPLNTWAVLMDPTLQRVTLDDLLFAGLDKTDTLTVVDRAQTKKLHAELTISDRRSLGKKLRADGLLLVQPTGEKSISVTLCDVHTGSTLQQRFLAWDPKTMENTATTIVDELHRTQKRFPQGVTTVYAVTPSVSKHLTHQYDHLQQGIADLIAHALRKSPGVAVVSIAEAREIRREHASTDGADIHRIVPAMIESEFDVNDKTRVLTLTCRLTGGTKASKKQTVQCPLSELAEKLILFVSAKLLDTQADPSSGVSLKKFSEVQWQSRWIFESAIDIAG
jgi:hypothetical protein